MKISFRKMLEGPPGKPCRVGDLPRGDALAFWPSANKQVLWGWKRDDEQQSRAVYFSARLSLGIDGIYADNRFFFYRHRTHLRVAEEIMEKFALASIRLQALDEKPRSSLSENEHGSGIVSFAFGHPSDEDADRVSRLLQRRPRRKWVHGEMPAAITDVREAFRLFPVDAYVGSGLSYECGLPTLCQVHDAFCLDDHQAGSFTFGSADRLPDWLAADPEATILSFCNLAVMAVSAEPSRAQQTISDLFKSGLIRQVLSDNVDNMLCKVDVPFTRTRGSGVFNEKFPVEFRTGTLLVVGIAADRRQIIAQARQKRMNVIVVDPCMKVSHGVQHLNYLRATDRFYRCTADTFFRELSSLTKEVAHG